MTRVYYGSPVSIPLIPNGNHVGVDIKTREKYVKDYVEYELVESIRKQFDAFLAGFKRVYSTNCEIFVS